MAKSVLICDDAAFMRVMIKDILTKNGYDVVGEAENGLVAVEKFNETKPDLVMMDITMPGFYRKAIPGGSCSGSSKKGNWIKWAAIFCSS